MGRRPKEKLPPELHPHGLLLVDKAEEMTSHDVVAITRGVLGFRKIGHCGTLDPMATGLLMLVLGKATKAQDALMGQSKEYSGTLKLGQTTTSQDREGEVLETREVPELTAEQVEAAFRKYTGDFEQIPPMVSAIKKDGVPLYKLARKGQEVERKARKVSVSSFTVTRIELPEVDFVVHCSKGFYVRTYAHEIGQDLGCGAHLTKLRRHRSGDFSVDDAITITDLRTAGDGGVRSRLIPLESLPRFRPEEPAE